MKANRRRHFAPRLEAERANLTPPPQTAPSGARSRRARADGQYPDSDRDCPDSGLLARARN